MPDESPLLPVMLRLHGRKCVVVGGGKVALRRVKSLLECGARTTVVAPETEEEIAALAQTGRLELLRRPYQPGDLHGAFLVVLASSSPEAQAAAANEAMAAGALVNRVDAEGGGDLDIPAHGRRGPLTLAVHTGGASARAAADIRNALLENLPPEWPEFLSALAEARTYLQARMPAGEAREAHLRLLAGEAGKQAFKKGGREGLLALASNPKK